MKPLGVAIIGCGGVTLQNHLPGLDLCAETCAVALCDNNPATLEQMRQATAITTISTKWEDIVAHEDVDAVSTPRTRPVDGAY